jgi:hypothetical protein
MAAPSSTKKIQLGVESTAGTAVAATAILACKAARIKDTRQIKIVPEDIGILVPTGRTYTPKLGAELDFPDSEATFEQLMYWGEAGIKYVGTGVADGAGTGKKYDYVMPLSSTKNTVKTYTIEAGDLTDAERMEYGFVSEFKLSGQRDQAVMIGGKWMGRQCAVNAFTGSLSAPTTNEVVLFNNSKLYIDDWGGTLGSTQKTSTLTQFTLNFKTGWKELPIGDGTVYFGSTDFADPSGTLDITFIYDTSATGAKTKWRAETGALIRLLFEGTTLSGAGTFSKKTLRIDVSGKWLSFDAPAEKDGFQVCTGKLQLAKDTAGTMFLDILVVNEVATVP